MSIIKKSFYLSIALVFLTSCGGGESSSDSISEPTPSPAPAPPPTPTPAPNTDPECNLVSTNLYYCSMNRQGLERELYVYIPESYSENSDPVPLLFSLHGYTSRAIWNLGYTGFQALADQDNFITIYPQGSILSTTGQTHWNVGGWTVGSTTDDIDFIESLIDWFGLHYNIDLNRVYSTGMSNGGFMSYHLACNLSSKIAAIASVTGSMTNQTYNACNPIHATSVLQIHGSSDTTVPYNGNSIMKPIPQVMDYWQTYNMCNSLTVDEVPDNNNDGYTGDISYYSACLNDVEVHLWYLTNFGHSWPSMPEDDIHGASVIWNFLKQYDINGMIVE